MRPSIRLVVRSVAAFTLALSLGASGAQAGVSDSEADREWSLDGCTQGHCYINAKHGLRNNALGKYLHYSDRYWGINLGWSATLESVVQIGPARDHRTRDLNYGDEVNLYVDKGGNVVYGSRDHGINLVWTPYPRNDWRVTGGAGGTPVRPGDKFGLYNLTSKQRLIYCERTVGVALMWAKDCNYRASQNTTTTTTSPQTFTIQMQKQDTVGGYIPYLGTFPILPANPAMRVTRLNFLTGWPAMLILKPGHSTSDCGNPAAFVSVLGVMTDQQMKDVFGTTTINIPLGQQLRFVGCMQDVGGQQIIPSRPVEITYQTLP